MAHTTSTVQLKCTAARGMFPFEAGILIRGIDQFYESMVDREYLQADDCNPIDNNDDVPALVDVNIIQEHGGKVLVELPREVISGGRRIWVAKSEVKT